MSTKFMGAFLSNAAEDCQQLLPGVRSHSVSFRQILDFCTGYRTIAIGCLFMFNDRPSCQRNLFKSGRAFLHYVSGPAPSRMVLSKFKPFFDAVGALDIDGATEIAQRAPSARVADSEYEEDFLFVRFLMARFFLGVAEDALEAMLAQWEAVLEGSEDPRLVACRGLFGRDVDVFHEGLDAYLESLEDRLRRLTERGAISMDQAATEARFSVEALALVVLAERLGLRVRKNYLYVPSTARPLGPPTAPPDAWTIVTD
jgi:hypothetical protein